MRTRKTVRWSDKMRVREICHLNNMPDWDKEAVWMSEVDYQAIKARTRKTVMMMMMISAKGLVAQENDNDNDGNNNIDNIDFCTRGLEFRTRAGAQIRTDNKLRNRSAVLDEQALQRAEHCHFSDPERIAEASRDESLTPKEVARQRAESDARFARSYRYNSNSSGTTATSYHRCHSLHHLSRPVRVLLA